MITPNPLATLRSHLEQIEEAIVAGSWETVTDTWTPPSVALSGRDTAEATALLARIEEAREQVARLETEAAGSRRQIDDLRRAGRAYVRNDALL